MSGTEDLRERFQALHEFIPAAERALSPEIWHYLVGGTETETTVARNRAALDALAFRPRVLRDVSRVDPSTRFLGHHLRLPLMLAPVGSLESFHPEAGAAVARAAGRFGVPFLLSSVSRPGLEEAASVATGPKIFQLYVRGDRAWVEAIGERARAAGYDAFCFTVDTAHYSRRERDIALRFVKPWRVGAEEGMRHQAALTWDDIAHFRARNPLPLILKGIATAEDAARAASLGVDYIYVSNHGGRQLDHGRGAIEILPEVVAAVRGRARIIIDGGFCRGTDILKAIALGADYVAIGRLYCYGLAAAGEAGVERVLELLEDEVRIAMGLLGVTRLDELDPTFLAPAQPLGRPHVWSAFPLLGFPGERG
jgi:isopentenyl diphosphate isomerase/L-lactate dehydrogenase-like FMN-dependent dehydrogenase